jgi:outer membrane protein OmpA-like peptidoglycan-associated protein
MKMNKVTRLILIILLLLNALPSFAQDKLKFGLQINLLLPSNEFPMENRIRLSFTEKALIRFDLSNKFMGQIGAGYGEYAGNDFDHDYYKSTLIPVDFRLMYLLSNSKTVRPYILGGVGGMYYKVKHKSISSRLSKPVDDHGLAGFVEGGLGIQINLGSSKGLDINAGMGYTTTDNLNYYKDGAAKDAYYFIGVGLLFGGGHKEEPIVIKEPLVVPPPPPAPKVEEKKPEPKVEIKQAEPPLVIEKAPIELEGIYFDVNKANLTMESIATLESDLAILKSNMNVRVAVTGYTDGTGNDKANLKLSLKRANEVKAWLVKNGIDEARITVSGLGKNNPAVPNDTYANMIKNRRVELKVIK